MYLICLIIAVCSSIIGSISGIGGGIIIKPIMDAITEFPPASISFMSGCTVLSMALVSYIRNIKSNIKLDHLTTIWIAMGACLGGYCGKVLFCAISEHSNITLAQSIILLAINIFVFIYLKYKYSIKTLHIKNNIICAFIGFILGSSSAFLGIGGGPINIVILSYFFSMDAKQSARNSLFIILFSQTTSFFTTVFTNTVPSFEIMGLILMCLGGAAGAVIGSLIEHKMNNTSTEKFFNILMIFLIGINVYNVICEF